MIRILLVGLGNKTLPGTRHNVGMMTVDAIAKYLNLSWTQRREWKSDITDTIITVNTKEKTAEEYHVTLIKPRKLMNISGSCVARAVEDLGISLQNLYIFHDDMQRDLGKVQLKYGGSSAGHNGIKSVMENLKTDSFKRIRIGIGRPPPELDDRSYEVVASFVLGKFTTEEIETLEKEVYPMWIENQGLELLCRGELIKKPKKKNKNKVFDPNKWEKRNKQSMNNIEAMPDVKHTSTATKSTNTKKEQPIDSSCTSSPGGSHCLDQHLRA